MCDEMKKVFRSESESATEEFAASLAQTLPRGTVLALHGNLGQGRRFSAGDLPGGWGLRNRFPVLLIRLFRSIRFLMADICIIWIFTGLRMNGRHWFSGWMSI